MTDSPLQLRLVVETEDFDAALAFYRDALGLTVRNDVSAQGFRWVTVGAEGQDVDIVLFQPHGCNQTQDGGHRANPDVGGPGREDGRERKQDDGSGRLDRPAHDMGEDDQQQTAENQSTVEGRGPRRGGRELVAPVGVHAHASTLETDPPWSRVWRIRRKTPVTQLRFRQ